MNTTTEPASTGRERIVAAALRLFERRGFASTSIADVAGEAGMLKGNLAYYFPTKPALLEAVLRARQAELQSALGADRPDDATPGQAIARLLDHVEGQAEVLASSGCPVGSLATELGKLDAQLHPPAAGLLLGLKGWLQLQFARALPEAAAGECAEHLLAVLQGAAVLAQAGRDAEVVRRRVAASRTWVAQVLADPEAAPTRKPGPAGA